jgi:hypothetical protein
MKFSPFPCYPVPLRPKYSPQHPVLKQLAEKMAYSELGRNEGFCITDWGWK